jgi:hypothetical protein
MACMHFSPLNRDKVFTPQRSTKPLTEVQNIELNVERRTSESVLSVYRMRIRAYVRGRVCLSGLKSCTKSRWNASMHAPTNVCILSHTHVCYMFIYTCTYVKQVKARDVGLPAECDGQPMAYLHVKRIHGACIHSCMHLCMHSCMQAVISMSCWYACMHELNIHVCMQDINRYRSMRQREDDFPYMPVCVYAYVF